ncbi:MAG: exopolyphosphatase [Calditrichaeota bacterium]|nr:exopolyphosphatase [Calditrichota bacterium]
MKFAAIDIGSNAVRLLLSRVIENGKYPIFKKESLIRIPIRLGEDAFVRKRISAEKAEQLVNTMRGFKFLIEAYQAIDYMACATSAMREAENGEDVVKEIMRRSGIKLDIVAGQKEADIIYANHFEERLDQNKSYLYIDVGGGSTELTLFSHNQSITSHSFNIGTVRLLHGLVPDSRWKDMKQWVQVIAPEFKPVIGIGSGGNINKMFKLSRIKTGKPISYKRLRELDKYLNTFSLDERIKILGLRPDRADVIILAADIFTSVMKWAKINRMYVPEIGLSDGMIRLLYERHMANRKS